MKNSLPADWPKKLYLLVFGWSCLAFSIAFLAWGPKPAVIVAGSSLCLAAGFRITELLIAVLTGVRKANSSAIALLMLLKLCWWGLLFIMSRHATKADLPAIGLGFGAFLLGIASLPLWIAGLPKISPPRSLGDS